jgi:hypothetical protein
MMKYAGRRDSWGREGITTAVTEEAGVNCADNEQSHDRVREEPKIRPEESEGTDNRLWSAIPRTTPKIKTRRIREFATDNLPEKSVLRNLLLEEKDEMDGIEFLAKMDLWLKLLRIESA